MHRTHHALPVALALVVLVSCVPATGPSTPAPGFAPSSPIISEVMAGTPGNNNFEFIELYNPSDLPIDLQGWSLWYRLATSEEDLLVYEWTRPALIPPRGFYLLVRSGEEIGRTPDARFEQSLNTSGGGLLLRNPQNQTQDRLAWGKAPEAYRQGEPAPAIEAGCSLQRRQEALGKFEPPNHAQDFLLVNTPDPQNVATASVFTPLRLKSTIEAQPKPGETFHLTLLLENLADDPLSVSSVSFDLPEGVELRPLQEGLTLSEGRAVWTPGALEPGGVLTRQVALVAPWTYLQAPIRNIMAVLEPPTSYAFSETLWIEIREGAIPVSIARSLVGSEVTVEGTATMYTGGYFAGSGNVKFYVEDPSGGVQVWAPSGEGELAVSIGDKIRVRGLTDLYRGAAELIPGSPEDVELLQEGEPPVPLPVPLGQAATDMENLPGRLVTVQGTATRIEEFSYSYEMDLADETGAILTLYIDKKTGISVEPFEEGRAYQASGILEVRDGLIQLYPRQAADLREIHPAAVILEVDAPTNVLPGTPFDLTLRAINYTDSPVRDLEIWVDAQPAGSRILQVLDGGITSMGEIRWQIAALEPGGSAAEVHLRLQPSPGASTASLSDFGLRLKQDVAYQVEPATPTHIGATVPISAIQGPGERSPYRLKPLTTRGVITGVFPDLGGFWIQSLESDGNPATSEGLFVALDPVPEDLSPGQAVEVRGQVREISSQTELHPASVADVHILEVAAATPTPVPLDPPASPESSAAYYETLEGMLVGVYDRAVVVGPTNRFGETVVTLAKHGRTRFWRGGDMGLLITVDDGSSEAHEDQSTLPYSLSNGDQMTDLMGPLAYTYGSYKIETLEAPRVEKAPISLPWLKAEPPDVFRVMTWNVENLFDILAPHPASPPLPRKSEYERDLSKVADTILAAGAPTLVGLQEVEHIGILEDLAALPGLLPYDYQPILIEGTDGRGIDVGYLVRGDRAQILEARAFPAPEGLTSRPPLMIRVRVQTTQGETTLYLLNNHFTSMSGGEEATEPRRIEQAAWNVEILERILSKDDHAHVIVLGDLNSFYDSGPLEVLRDAGLRHIFERLAPEDRYTYVYRGVSQALDHILVTPGLFDQLVDATVLHLDADYGLPSPDDTTALRKSDHDPLIAEFMLAD